MTTLLFAGGRGGCCWVFGVVLELISEEFLLSWKAWRPKSDTLGWLELLTVLDPLAESMSPAMRGPIGFEETPPRFPACIEDGGVTKLLGKGRFGMGPMLPIDDDVP